MGSDYLSGESTISHHGIDEKNSIVDDCRGARHRRLCGRRPDAADTARSWDDLSAFADQARRWREAPAAAVADGVAARDGASGSVVARRQRRGGGPDEMEIGRASC